MAPFADGDAIDPERLYEHVRRGEPFTLLDVRNRAEHDAWPLDGATETVVEPYQRLVAAAARGEFDDVAADLAGPVVVVCGVGEASADVAGRLREAGVEAYTLAGGMRGWARVYAGTELPVEDADVAAIQYRRPASGCLSYLLVAGDEAAVVDPLRAFADRYRADAAGRDARVRYAIDTHVHADHVSGVRAVADAADAADTVEAVETVLPAGARDRGLAFDPDRVVADGDDLRLGGATLRAVHLPGHTSELTGLRVGDCLLTGDALFVESVGRPDLERGAEGAADAAATLYATLHDRIAALSDDVRICPGHYGPAATPADDGTYTARLGELRPSLGLLSPDLDEASFVDAVAADLPPRPNEFERVIAINLGVETADDEAAFEVELGPNNCAVAPDAGAGAGD